MKYQPHLIHNPKTGNCKIVYIDPSTLHNSKTPFDNLHKVATTDHSPLKVITLKKQP